MGIKGLGQYIKKHCPQAIQEVTNDMEQYRGKRVVLEVSGLMYKYVSTCASLEREDHLMAYCHLHDDFVAHGAFPCFVFDGKQTLAKLGENLRRAKIKQQTMKKAQASISR